MDKTSIAIVGGCGHVGIPLGLAFAAQNFPVTLVDINADAVQKLNNLQLPFNEENAEELLKNHLGRNLIATCDQNAVAGQDVVIFVVGTPVDRHLNPCVNDVLDIISSYLPLLNDDQLIVMRSTLFPGTLRIIDNLLKTTNCRARLAFCPERIVQGKGLQEIASLPQIVSGTTPEALQEAMELFNSIAPAVLEATPEEAELAKLMTNCWRYVEFAIANQFYIMAQQSGVDFYKLHGLMTKDYPRARHFAKPGLTAGPCLLKDTMQLAAFFNNNFFLGHSAMLVNEGLPCFLVEQLAAQFEGSLVGKKIAILGMAFKANSDDIRDSLSFKLKKQLEQRLALVMPVEPFCDGYWPLAEALAVADGLILGVPHDIFLEIQPQVPYVDCWGVWDNESITR